jgi:hypothetical protein
MGGSDKGSTASASASQQLLDEFKRQQTASQIQGAFNQLGKGVATQLSPFQQPQGQMQIPGPGQAASQGGPNLAPTGALFQGMAGGVGGGGGIGGIDEQQLAMILQRLGYGG